MPRYRVKICGITRPQDARLAVDLGADAIGLVFYPPSPRAIGPEQVASIAAGLPAFVTVVGLFVNPEPKAVEAVIDSGMVNCLQFHGEESVDFCSRFHLPFIKAVRVRDLAQAAGAMEAFQGRATILLDSHVQGSQGGSGTRFDWSIARQLVAAGTCPVLLAGGLDPENVAQAIGQVKPYGVDVSSGVESAPGIKDAARLAAFLRAVHEASAPAGA